MLASVPVIGETDLAMLLVFNMLWLIQDSELSSHQLSEEGLRTVKVLMGLLVLVALIVALLSNLKFSVIQQLPSASLATV